MTVLRDYILATSKYWLLFFIPFNVFAKEVQSDLQLEVITVTAQKREQSLQDVPLAVTAIDGNHLKNNGIESVKDLHYISPSFILSEQHNKVANTTTRIRGVGTTGVDAAFEGSVGFYVDGVYRSRAAMVFQSMLDIEMLQVLRGPQGTLFGKNNSAGALLFDSTKPTDEFNAGVTATLGNYSKQKLTAFVNAPVSDGLILRVAAMHDERDGFNINPITGNDTNNVDTDAIKFQALYTLNDTEIRLIADYAQSDQLCCMAIYGRIDPESDAANPALLYQIFEPLYRQASPEGLYYDTTGNVFDRRIANQTDAIDELEEWGVQLKLDHQLNESLVLNSNTSYRYFNDDQTNGDWDTSQVDLGRDNRELYEFKTFSQELSLTGEIQLAGIDTEFVTGLFYQKEELEHLVQRGTGEFLGENFQTAYGGSDFALLPPDDLARPGTFFNQTAIDHTDEVQAAYGHFTFNLTSDLSLTTGLRYSKQTKELARENLIADNDADMFNYMAQNQLGLLALGATYNGPSAVFDIEEEELTYTLGVQYKIDDSQLYARYAKGYKAGGISLNNDAGGGLVSINTLLPADQRPDNCRDLPLCYTDESDPTYAPEFVHTYEVGMKSSYQGGRGRVDMTVFRSEFEDIQASTWTGTQLLTYNADTALSQGVEVENTYLMTESLTSLVAVTWLKDAKYGDEANEFQRALPGRDFEFAPEFSAVVNLNYDADWGPNKSVFGDINFTYKGDHETSLDVDYRQSYSLLGARIGVRLLNDDLSLSLSCNNCLDEDYLLQTSNANFQFHEPAVGIAAAPRTWQFSVDYQWN